MRRELISGSLACWILLLWAVPARAHDLAIECTLFDTAVETLSFYDDDTPCQKGKVKVMQGERVIASGTTNDKGQWSFPRPAPGRYLVTINDGAGHFAERTMTIPSAVSADPATPKRVSDGPSRESFTTIRWIGLVIGIVVIAALAVAAHFFLRRKT